MHNGTRLRKRPPAAGLGAVSLVLLSLLSGGAGAEEGYGEAELRAILFGRERADTLDAGVVLLAHRTHYEHHGSGERERHEHQIWYVRDPDDPRAAALRTPAVLLDNTHQAFGLTHARVLREGDTLDVTGAGWSLRTPEGWPPEAANPWREAHATLPPWQAGDVFDLSYSLLTRPSRTRIPDAWTRIVLRTPRGPTVERHVVLTYERGLEGFARVIHNPQRLLRHYGADPKLELLTGNLPPGAGDAKDLQAPAVLFSCAQAWRPARRVLAEHYMFEIARARTFLAAVGDSLVRNARGSRERIGAIFHLLRERCAPIPRTLLESDYYPRPLAIPWQGRAADEIDRALLFAALADVALIKVDLFLGRSDPRGFDPELVTPQQFDRLLVRLLVAEEDRHIFLDPSAGDLAAAQTVVDEKTVLLGVPDEWARLLQADAQGHLHDYATARTDN
ncbi:MAG: hypothetical protein GF330_02995 [Candidatus Eisenbacteria bacterium]|nr:hypothetical protein [Candidatus Eisenbacteria bacterium]